MLFPPLLETQVEDEDAEREEEEDVCDAKCSEDKGAWAGGQAKQVRTDKGAVG